MAQFRELANRVKSNLSLVREQKGEMIGLLTEYVEKVTSLATDVMEDQNQDLSKLKGINSMLETAMGVLLGLSGEVAGHMSGSVAKPSDLQEIKPTLSVSVKSAEQFVSGSASSGKFLEGLNDTDTSAISKLYQRIDMIELAMKGYSAEVRHCCLQQTQSKQEMEEKHQNLEKKLENLVTERGAAEARESERLDCIENDMAKFETDNKNLAEKVSHIEQKQDTRFDKMAEKLQEMTMDHPNSIAENTSKVDEMEKHLKKMKSTKGHDASRLDSLMNDVETLNNKQKQQSLKINKIDKQVESMISQCSSLQGQIEDVRLVKQGVEMTKSKTDTFADTRDICDCLKAVRTVTRSLEEISNRMDVTESSVKSLILYREDDENKKQELKKRMSMLEINRQKDKNYFMKELKEVKSLLDKVTDDVETLASKVVNLESTQQQTPIGFTACYSGNSTPLTRGRTKDFKYVLCNEGNSYNKDTGIFTAPRDGLYVTSVTLSQSRQGSAAVYVCHKKSNGDCVSVVCDVLTKADNDQNINVEAVKMMTGDTLEVEVFKAEGDARLSGYSRFSCFSVG